MRPSYPLSRLFVRPVTSVMLVLAALLLTTVSFPAAARDPAKEVKTVVVQRVDTDTATAPVAAGHDFQVKVLLKDKDDKDIDAANYGDYVINLLSDNHDAASAMTPVPQRLGYLWTVQAVGSGKANLTATAKRTVEAGGMADQEVKSEPLAVSVNAPFPTRFEGKRITVDLVDTTTARYLFGKQFASEFHILKVGLINDLPANVNGQRPPTLIIYSSTIELAITWEKKLNPKSGSRIVRKRGPAPTDDANTVDVLQDGPWTQVVYTDVLGTYNAALRSENTPLGRPIPNVATTLVAAVQRLLNLSTYTIAPPEAAALEDLFSRTLPDVHVTDDDRRGPRPYARLLHLFQAEYLSQEFISQQEYQKHPEYPRQPGDRRQLTDRDRFLLTSILEAGGIGVGTVPYLAHRFLYKPYSLEAIEGTIAARNGASRRSRTFRILEFLGTAAAAVTALPGLNGGTRVQTALDRYQAAIIPGLQRLWPDMSEIQRQNFTTLALRPLEQVGDTPLNRYMFIPKGEIPGLLRGYQVRIGEVHTNYFAVKAGVVDRVENIEQTGTVETKP
jgi:hypothetical protein